MSDVDSPWEPPTAGTETEHLLGALERLRTTFRWKTDGLDTAGLRTRIGASALTLGGLLKHLAFVEDYTFTTKLSGRPPTGGPWSPGNWDDDPDWEFTSAAGDSAEQLYAVWDEAVDRSRARLAAVRPAGLDQPADISGPDGSPASLRRLLFDLVEEYGRHAGHADLLREAVDGRVGEDPPPGWRAQSGPGTGVPPALAGPPALAEPTALAGPPALAVPAPGTGEPLAPPAPPAPPGAAEPAP